MSQSPNRSDAKANLGGSTRSPAPPPGSSKTVPRNPNLVAKMANEEHAGTNPLLSRLYSSSAPGASGGVPNVLSTSAKKIEAPREESQPKPLHSPEAATSRTNQASSLPLFTQVKYSDADVRNMLQRNAQPAANQTAVVRRRQTPPARLIPLSSETQVVEAPRAAKGILVATKGGSPVALPDDEDAEAAALNVVSRFRTTSVNTPKEFTYLTMRPRGVRDMYNPYDLVVVSHKDINPQHYFTISTAGVTKFDDGESEFIDLKAWEREHRIYHRLVKLDFFHMYKKWKSFSVWRKLVRRTATQTYKNHLDENLFYLHPNLSDPLDQVREICLNFQNDVIYLAATETRPLQSWVDAQNRNLDHMRRKLDKTVREIKEILEDACQNAMQTAADAREREMQQGNSLTDDPTKRRTNKRGLDAAGMADQGRDNSRPSYIEQSQKRAVCRRLTNYICLCDYMVINSLAVLAMKAIRDAHTDLQYPRPPPPPLSPEEREKRSKEADAKAKDDKKKRDIKKEEAGPFTGPIFIAKVHYDEHSAIRIMPDGESFSGSVEKLLNDYIKMVASVPRLAQMEAFKAYTEHAIVDHSGDTEFGHGPNVGDMIESEEEYKVLIQAIRMSMTKAFQTAQQYANKYIEFSEMYKENAKLRADRILKKDYPLEWFKESLATYRTQTEMIDKIPNSETVALFSVEMGELTEVIKDSPSDCVKIIQEVLPKIGKSKNDALLDDLSKRNTYLSATPSTVEELDAYLSYVEDLGNKMDSIVSEFENVRDMFALFHFEQIPISEEDDQTFRSLTRVQFEKLKNVHHAAEESHEIQIRALARMIEEQLQSLRERMVDVKTAAANPMIEDENADMETVIGFVTDLQERTDTILKRERELTRLQEKFLSESTPIPELRDEVAKDVNDKARLWNGMRDWEQLTTDFATMPFKQLDPVAVSEHINKYQTLVKQVARTQKKNNLVVQKLKAKVEEWNQTKPIIQALKNSKLRDRHIAQLDEAIGKITDDNKVEKYLSEIPDHTLGMLLRANVITMKDAIMQISVTATEEDKLDQAINKIANIWRGTTGKPAVEFVVNAHKDSKDFVLSGQSVEEITAQLEESLLVVSTIGASKYCNGQIRVNVDRWETDLRLTTSALDKWLELQRNWMYLENVFSSLDIRQQWKSEFKVFEGVDRSFKELMRNTSQNPSVYQSLTYNAKRLNDQFAKDNELLEGVLSNIEKKLEERRKMFPRFYFLSNDDLLDVLAKTRSPMLIMPHMLKMFDGIKSLTLSESNITHINSMEGEKVPLVTKTIKAGRGAVEQWLILLEEEMFRTLRHEAAKAVTDYVQNGERTKWIFRHPVQLVLIASQTFWTRNVENALTCDNVEKAMLEQRDLNYSQLEDLAGLTGLRLSRVERGVLSTLITIDVHGRDLVDEMVEAKVSSVTDFGWTKQLRSSWKKDPRDGEGNMFIQQNNSEFVYGYEYLGAQGRLVITPLTDRVYMTITGALKLYLGAAPAGPAGTGKTETTKDLAKNLARQCIVYNCSDGVTYKMMEKFFMGLIQTGAWTCLDEFNRINIEVLSVIAAQLNEIKLALQATEPVLSEFTFQGNKRVKIRRTYGVFITMNPGYAGRTELPDNLKILFRPVAVMTPDFRMIAEVILYSEGFKNAKELSLKITQLYKLSSEQLSPQDHYDFGMRALKSILVMAGDLKRSQSGDEDLTLIVACNDSNIPKFVADDVPLFNGIMADLFPGIKFPSRDYPELLPAMQRFMDSRSLTAVPTWVNKGIQYYETLIVRHGVMLVGQTNTGKTEARDCIAYALGDMHARGSANKMARPVHQYVLNPKSIYMWELYGMLDVNTNEWRDGHLADIAKKCVKAADDNDNHSWIVFDGPVDTLWIESMNSVLDDSKLLCLDNGDRLKFPDTMHLLFEVADLAVASPATVSRCGMVYVDGDDMPWTAVLEKWHRTKLVKSGVERQTREYIDGLFREYIPKGLAWLKHQASAVMISGGDLNVVQSCCDLFTATIKQEGVKFKEDPKDDVTLPPDDSYWKERNEMCRMLFAYCFTWSVGANVDFAAQEAFDAWLRELEPAPFPAHGSVFDFFVDFKAKKFMGWNTLMNPFTFDPKKPFFDILVPTVDTVRYSYIAKTLIAFEKPLLFTGHTGVGKSVILSDMLTSNQQDMHLVVIVFQFSAQTSSPRTQEMVESKLHGKTKLGAKPGERVILFVDDLNMPALETFGASPPVELVRQLMGNGGFFDRKVAGFYKRVEDVTVISACGPPEGGRNPVTQRLTRMFHIMQIPNLSDESINKIFLSILQGFFVEHKFNADVRDLAKSMIEGTVEIFQRMKDDLRPRPSTPHYTFNLRDIAKVCQGLMQVVPRVCSNSNAAARLWIHENMRCFYDRLTSSHDREYFTKELLMTILPRRFPGTNWNYNDLFEGQPIAWGDFLRPDLPAEDKVYEEVSDFKILGRLFDEYLEDYNSAAAQIKEGEEQQTTSMNLVFFRDHCEHLARIIRIIRQPRGNALLVGVGGSGKQSLSRLATFIANYKRFEIAVGKGYTMDHFHDKLLSLYEVAGIKCQPLVFLITDSQIVHEGMLEDINNILNSGEVPSLFSAEERDKKVNAVMEAARERGITSRDEMWGFFISRVRDNFHTVLCMSPVGDAFRTRCRQFPSLTNCCSIDWFNEWPREALRGVAERLMAEVDFGTRDELREPLTELCVDVHTTAISCAESYWDEMRRRYYITPTSYLEFISLYRSLLDEKSSELTEHLDRLTNGKIKMKETEETIAIMRQQLQEKQPLLEKAQKDNLVLVADLEVRREKASVVKEEVAKTQAAAAKQQEESAKLKASAEADLAEAMPEVEAAIAALDSITNAEVSELKSMAKPVEIVVVTLKCLMYFFEAMQSELDKWSGAMDWKGAKEFLSSSRVLDKITHYPRDDIRPQAIIKVQKEIASLPVPFTPDNCAKSSQACRGICMFVLAMIKYNTVSKEVAPKRRALAEAQAELAITNKALAEAEAALKKVVDELDTLQRGLDESTMRRDLLVREVDTCRQRLQNAESLSGSLKNEAIRWNENIKRLEERLVTLPVEMFLSAACVSYFGAFTARFRKIFVRTLVDRTMERNLPINEGFSLVAALGDPVEILNWQICSLPTDETSTENAIIVTMSTAPRRWPLLIDPQGQAAKWITKRAKQDRQLVTMKQTDNNYLVLLENSIRAGTSVLIDDVPETLDPALEPLLMRQIHATDGGDAQISINPPNMTSYDDRFRFYICTKLSNPHYLPDVCIKVTLVNFTVTMDGLEDQMLGEVVAIERRELEEEKNKIIQSISDGQRELKRMEENILEKLKNAKGNILDDDKLINDLKTTQSSAQFVSRRQEEAKEKISIINKTRELYRPVANRCSILFFVLADMANIDPMYQNSLEFFKRLVAVVVESTVKPDGFDNANPLPELFDEHLLNLKERITAATYTQVCRGLFNKDKTILSLLTATSIARNGGDISEAEWQYFIRATAFASTELPPKPENLAWASELQWGLIEALSRVVPAFKDLFADVKARPNLWKQWVQSQEPHLDVLPGGGTRPEDAEGNDWETGLTAFQKILLIRAWREEKLLFALTEYVKNQMGRTYVEAPPFNLEQALGDSHPGTPIVFILSQGADPMNMLQAFAESHGKRLNTVSLGQGQGKNALKAIEECRKDGEWAMLQNCHLSKTFMPDLETQVTLLNNPTPGHTVNKTFRLWLTSMPTDFFPVYVLQNSIKLTNEPPTGLRANMLRCYNEIKASELDEFFTSDEEFVNCKKEHAYKKMVYALCFFHSVVLERKKFGPLGWNVLYEWNDTDFHVSKEWLKLFLKEQATVPWESLEYIIGQINYGGRVTDPQDRITLMIILQQYLTPKVLDESYAFSSNTAYRAPSYGNMDHYRSCISELSLIDDPEVFGMHENANLRYQLQRSELLMSTILSVQPRLVGTKGGGPSPEEQVMSKCDEFIGRLPSALLRENAGPTTFTTLASGLPNSMSTVLSHELVKYNALQKRIAWSLEEMKKALQGLTVLSEDLDKMYQSFLNDQVPGLWTAVSYSSLKPLGAWFKDLIARMTFIRTWLENGEPSTFWIGGFFNASAFMTGTLQAYARQHGDSVDKLGFSFTILDQTADDITGGPESGKYVSGIFTDAWRWDNTRRVMADSLPGEPYDVLPVVHFLPEVYHKTPANFHGIPMYRTTIRKGNISSLGASSNYVLSIEAPTEKPRAYWALKGAACICALNN